METEIKILIKRLLKFILFNHQDKDIPHNIIKLDDVVINVIKEFKKDKGVTLSWYQSRDMTSRAYTSFYKF